MTDGRRTQPKKGIRLHGTFGPGQHMVEYRWQLPYSGEAEVKIDVGMPPTPRPHASSPPPRDMKLEVPGFPPPQSTNDGQGQRARDGEAESRRTSRLFQNIEVVIKGLPTRGPGRSSPRSFSGAGLVFGLVLGNEEAQQGDQKTERARLLAEIEEPLSAPSSRAIGREDPMSAADVSARSACSNVQAMMTPAPVKKKKAAV